MTDARDASAGAPGSPDQAPPPVHPALVKEARERANAFGSRIADAVTRFAGSSSCRGSC
jgi:hypothetical protein